MNDATRVVRAGLPKPSKGEPFLPGPTFAAPAGTTHETGALVAFDNTSRSCLGQQPLTLGADFSLASDTKITTGHSDLILGHVSVNDEGLAERLRTWRKQMGAIAGPMEVWLAHRSLATLHLRM